ncbi:hypothetical protein [Streptomyces sp. NPDC006193]|uniref:hypothetical protein n=1 Tax=Streptomyces sp. NPDC006193 TaxID=3155717 RepID=UPI0033BD62E9
MLALRLTRAARPAVQLRRLLVAAAAAGTGFLLLSCLGHALGHPRAAGAAALRLAWCGLPLAATVYLALAVARTDPGARPRAGLSAVGLGPGRLMAHSALTTALSCALGSLLALLFFLHLRGDLTGLPFHGAAAGLLAADQPLPVPAALTLLALVPAAATAAVALALRPVDPRPTAPGPRRLGRAGAYAGRAGGAPYGRAGRRPATSSGDGGPATATAAAGPRTAVPAAAPGPEPAVPSAAGAEPPSPSDDPPSEDRQSDDPPAAHPGRPPAGLPWGAALVAAGLAVQAYAGRSAPVPSLAVLTGWLLTASGAVLAAPGLTHLCGRLLQSVRPGALRLLAGRILMTEATRIGRPLGVVCAVASAGCALTALRGGPAPSFGPLTGLGALVVGGCTLAALLTAAVESRQCRAESTAALLRLGAPAAVLRAAAALRAAALLALFAPLTLAIGLLSALPAAR